MEELLGVLTDDEDFLELLTVIEHPRASKVYRIREDQFVKWSDKEFIARFRLSKDAVKFVLQNIREEIAHSTDRNNAVSPEDTLFVTLRFYATGSFLQTVGDFVGISKATVCQIIPKVSRAIAGLAKNFIKMSMTEEDCQRNSQQFYDIAQFPKCIGSLDCTHIKICSPGGEEPEIYRNRKGFFSLNVQAICDATCRIQNLVVRWPGSSHDSTIFNNSRIRARFEQGEFRHYVLVGDSDYAIRPFLITPLGNPVEPEENLFNESQIRTRNPIERCFEIWKRRFPVLAFGIRLKLKKVEAVVVATAVLHNIACMFNDELPPNNEEEQVAVNYVNNVEIGNFQDNANNKVRQQLIDNYFRNLL